MDEKEGKGRGKEGREVRYAEGDWGRWEKEFVWGWRWEEWDIETEGEMKGVTSGKEKIRVTSENLRWVGENEDKGIEWVEMNREGSGGEKVERQWTLHILLLR